METNKKDILMEEIVSMDLNNYLKKISFNSSISDLEEYYALMASRFDLAKEIGYKRHITSYNRKDGTIVNNGKPYFQGLFHFSMSVKVFSTSRFIPFKFIDYNQSNGSNYDYNYELCDNAVQIVNKLVSEGAIKYNYADFLTEVSKTNAKISSIEFDVKKDQYGEVRIVDDELRPYGADQSQLLDVLYVSDYQQLLAPDSFVVQFANVYFEQVGIKEQQLQFSLYAFDSDAEEEANKLTHFIIISSNKDENEAFFYTHVRKVRDIASRIRTKHIQNLIQKTRFEAIKSAISAIMSRNMSHNLGSHYLYYTKAHLEKVATDFLDYGDQLGKFAPDVRGAAKVLGYVQGRMDYLATVISNDKYPYGAVNFKSHIFDELTVDDFSTRHFDTEKKKNLRTTNYLLTNLVLSENFTRPDILTGDIPVKNYWLLLQVKYMTQQGVYSEFTGSVYNMEEENEVKKALSQLQIALPGGTMSCHAFFNVVENFIRNSAKYLQSDFKATEVDNIPFLNCTIAIRPNEEKKDFYDFIIYDNKENANRIVDPAIGQTLFESIVGKINPVMSNDDIITEENLGILGRLKITDKNGHIEKEAKGIKEMLFSSVWMNAYHFGDNTYADIIAHINDFYNFENETVTYNEYKKKLDFIEDYAFKFVQVIDKGEYLHVLTREDLQISQEKDVTASLGLLITLPEFKQEGVFVPNEDVKLMKQQLLTLFADIVNVPKDYAFQKEDIEYSGCFPRPYFQGGATQSDEKFRSILRRRFHDFDKYIIQLGDDKSDSLLGPLDTEKQYIIRFKRHLNKNKATLFETNKDYAYADSVSGGNFTITMQQLLEEGWNGSGFNEDTRFFALKVLESSLTRITIIDERLFNSAAKGNEEELSLKNIRVLNYNTFEDKMSDVLVTSNEYISQGIKGESSDQQKIDFIKQRANEAITEAYVSVKRKPFDSLSIHERNELNTRIEYVYEFILTTLFDAIKEERHIIEKYKKETDDVVKMSYKKNIRNYVETLDSKTKNATALIELALPWVESIREQIVNMVNEFADGDLSCILQGNNFRDGKENTLFLSIHLGLIEKMLKNSEWLNSEITTRLASKNARDRKGQKVTDRLSKERVEEFMNILKEKFTSTDREGNKELFISIHSGRGNFSKELEGPLRRYPFITLSAIENAFNNSKYLLSQVFYNTVYIGKGVANEQLSDEI